MWLLLKDHRLDLKLASNVKSAKDDKSEFLLNVFLISVFYFSKYLQAHLNCGHALQKKRKRYREQLKIDESSVHEKKPGLLQQKKPQKNLKMMSKKA